MSDLTYISGVDRVTISAEKTAEGLEKVISALDGFYDDLILYERAWENWENKSFNIRAQEIEKQAALGTLSSYDQAMMWKELTDSFEYGWQNVWKAEQKYHEKMYDHSREWIEDQKRLGNLSYEEMAEAWQRVYDKFDDINIKYEAASNIREALLKGAWEETDYRRLDSDRWMARQDLYDGGDYKRQVDDYDRRIAAEMELLREIEGGTLNGAKLGTQEQKEMWLDVYMYIEDLQDKQYLSARRYLEQSVNDYVDATKEKLKYEYEQTRENYEKQLDEVDEYYDGIIKKRREADRDEELQELYRLEKYYRDAVTKEGQDKHDDILDRIKDIENEAYEDELATKRDREKDAIRDEMEEASERYELALENVESIRSRILGMSGEIALSGANTAIAFGDSMIQLTGGITGTVEDIFAKSQQALAQYVINAASVIESGLGMGNSTTNNSISLNMYDYGSKNFNSTASAALYSDQLVNKLKEALRSTGVK